MAASLRGPFGNKPARFLVPSALAKLLRRSPLMRRGDVIRWFLARVFFLLTVMSNRGGRRRPLPPR